MKYFIAITFLVAIAYAEEPAIAKKSKLTFTGRLQAQFHASNIEKVKYRCNTFNIRRARVCANYEKGIMDAKIEYDLGEGKAKLKDGFINLKILPQLSLRFGQFKKPFSLWELTSDAKTMVIERDNRIMGSKYMATNQIIIKDGLYAGHDIGAMFFGGMGKFFYSIGVFNGSGETPRDNDNAKLIGIRLGFTPIKDFDVGVAFSQYPVIVGKKEEFKRAFEIWFEYGLKGKIDKNGPWIQTEILYGDNPAVQDTFAGVAFIGGYNVKLDKWLLSSIRPAIRVDYAQRDTDDKNSICILVTPGIDLFFADDNRLQINLDMVIPREEKNNEEEEIELGPRIQFQMVI